MARYAVLLGYGMFDPSKKVYKKYLDSFANFVKKNKVDKVVLSGGHTDPRHPFTSEAMSMESYLLPHMAKNVEIILENNSLTSHQNIEFTKSLVDIKKGKITVFCDNIRPPKIMWYVQHYWFGMTKRQIESYFLDYSFKYYLRHFTTEKIGKEIGKGISYKNVTVMPCRMRIDIDDAIGNQISSILEINSLYDKKLNDQLMKVVKIKFGLI